MATGPINRRSVLATVGSLTATGATGTIIDRDPFDDDDSDYEHTADEKYDEEEEPCYDCGTYVSTAPCGHTIRDRDKCDSGRCESCTDCIWPDSAFTVKNCSDCTRAVQLQSTGKVGEVEELTASEVDDLSGSLTIYVESGEKRHLFFTGDIRRIQTESGDLNISISQRNEFEANGSQCK